MVRRHAQGGFRRREPGPGQQAFPWSDRNGRAIETARWCRCHERDQPTIRSRHAARSRTAGRSLLGRIASPCRPFGRSGLGFDGRCQSLRALGFLRPSAYICAYRRHRRWVQHRPPIDYHFLGFYQIAPAFEAVRRQPQRRSIFAKRQSRPLLCLDVHRPDCLCRTMPFLYRDRRRKRFPASSFLGFLGFPLVEWLCQTNVAQCAGC